MAEGEIRIIDAASVETAAGQYIVVDSSANGVGKIELVPLLEAFGATSLDQLDLAVDGETAMELSIVKDVGGVETEIARLVLRTATGTADGVMAAADKAKLDGIDEGATADTASDSAPLMDGEASAGTGSAFSRADHVHPSDTSKADATATQTALDAKADKRGAADRLLAGASRTVLGEAGEGTFLSRVCPSKADGVAEISEVRGNTVVWNQIAPIYTSTDWGSYSNNYATVSFADGTATLTVVADSTISYARQIRTKPASSIANKLISGHKYIVATEVIPSVNVADFYLWKVGFPNSFIDTYQGAAAGKQTRIAAIVEIGASEAISQLGFGIYDSSVTVGDTVDFDEPQIFDLTIAYGAGNEPTIAEFFARYGSDYKPYSAPRLLDANIAGINDLAFPQQTLRGVRTAQDVMTNTGIERHIGAVDLGTLTWFGGGTNTPGIVRMRATIPNLKPVDNGVIGNVACVKYIATTANNTYRVLETGVSVELNSQVSVYDPDYNTVDKVAAFKAAMSGVILIYELATPTTEQFDTPIDLTYSVEEDGTETWLVPDGDAPTSAPPTASIAYPMDAADLRDMPLSAIAPVENGVASANYAVGDYLIRNGVLYKVTTAIAAGESIPASSISARTVWQMVQEATA